jgi:predicted transcriptional regulator
METYSERTSMAGLTKKTTILLPPELHSRLTRLAAQRGTSIGELIRTAVEVQYGLGASPVRLAAVEGLAALALPVGSPAEMKHESVEPARSLDV